MRVHRFTVSGVPRSFLINVARYFAERQLPEIHMFPVLQPRVKIAPLPINATQRPFHSPSSLSYPQKHLTLPPATARTLPVQPPQRYKESNTSVSRCSQHVSSL
ncbi:hypothetical protein E2C01_090986 [Portunus trituberculatus]|uniref:Uncharacterized protein n=1 Tax=Portunus trituberculatus TaxID=210409 RepID=A0A5B7JG72_PORTR|nr:hypothetical protein [Portunus trituberculatus]